MPAVHHTVVQAPGEDRRPDRAVAFLHGILGQGSNWRSFARELTARRPEWQAVLVDLRAHGDSREVADGPDSIDAAADDVAALLATRSPPVHAVLGHSFGGKVALALLGRPGADLETLCVVDSLPGARPGSADADDALEVVRGLAALPDRFPSREAFLDALRAQGRSDAIAKWLAMQLDRAADGGYRFGLDLARIRALLDDYVRQDLWARIDPPPPGVRVHLVIGGRSPMYSPADRARAQELADRHAGRVSAHVLPDAGHWVHVDDPAGLLAIMERAL